jgi:hypothetical protein
MLARRKLVTRGILSAEMRFAFVAWVSLDLKESSKEFL